MSDRLIGYLPKTLALLWVQVRERIEEEARAYILPEPQIAVGTRVEIKKDGDQGTVSWVGQNIEGDPVASVTIQSGTRGSIPVADLTLLEEVKTEDKPPAMEDPEIDQLAKQCLGLRSWSQIRIFADSNPNVIIRMQEIASTKAEKRVINNLPSLIIGYIERANDRNDLEWLPTNLLNEVETLLSQPQQSIA